MEDCEDDFDFLVIDQFFQSMEEYLILNDHDVSICKNGVQAQWVPIAAATIRMLTSKVEKKKCKKDVL